MTTDASSAIQVASRVHGFSYAIRNIVTEAPVVQARGLRVRYMNIGDPVAAGFQTPPHLVEAARQEQPIGIDVDHVARLVHGRTRSPFT